MKLLNAFHKIKTSILFEKNVPIEWSKLHTNTGFTNPFITLGHIDF